MSAPLVITLDSKGTEAGMQRLRRALADRRNLHAEIAAVASEYVKDFVAKDAGHKTAEALGAAPTKHMAKTANRIGSQSDSAEARITIPRASRLRAAFGSYIILPKDGKKFLTIPVAAAAYGKRAGQVGELEFKRIHEETPKGLRWVPYLVVAGSEPVQKMYRLIRKAAIKEDSTLLPFTELPEVATRATIAFFDDLTAEPLT